MKTFASILGLVIMGLSLVSNQIFDTSFSPEVTEAFTALGFAVYGIFTGGVFDWKTTVPAILPAVGFIVFSVLGIQVPVELKAGIGGVLALIIANQANASPWLKKILEYLTQVFPKPNKA